MSLDPWTELAQKNHNRRYEVKGQVEIGDDGYLEVCLLTAKGEQILHLHRYPNPEGKDNHWDCWVFENNGKTTKRLSMTEKRLNDAGV